MSALLEHKRDFHHPRKAWVALPWKFLTGRKHQDSLEPWNGFIPNNFWNSVCAGSIQMAQRKWYYFNLFVNLSSQPFLNLLFSPVQRCKSGSCRESHKDALACLDSQQYYYEKCINLSVGKGFKGCCIHLLPEAEHLITHTCCSKKIISSS